mmetsp:Transcript_9073/g.20463  ORF Transcript_9073/g.20463 Transcript_9073/m.20463 type:complete len:1632 (-) Transcript_9073:54-4949(-)
MKTADELAVLVVKIQKIARGYMGRRRHRTLKKYQANVLYESNFEDSERVYQYTFRSNGAARKIQLWFRNLHWRRKREWKAKYEKFVAKRLRDKILFRAVMKSRGGKRIHFDDILEAAVRSDQAGLIAGRVVRGFLGRCSFGRSRKERVLELKERESSAVLVQCLFRRAIARCRHPQIGQRFRMLVAKRRRWEVEQQREQMAAALQGGAESAELAIGAKGVKGAAAAEEDEVLSESDVSTPEDQTHIPGSPLESPRSAVSSKSNAKSLRSDDPLHSPKLKHDRRLFVSEHYLQRRASFFFPHLRLGNQKFFLKMGARALQIQCSWRQHAAWHMRQQKLHHKQFRCMSLIYLWCVRVFRRWRKKKALRLLQCFWRFKTHRSEKRCSAVTKIQSMGRARITRNNFRKLLRLRVTSANRMVRWALVRLSLRRVRRKAQRLRMLLELGDAGRSCYESTSARWVAQNLWTGIGKKSHSAQHELQKLFVANCVNGGLESSKLLKLMKECGVVKDKDKDKNQDINSNLLEIEFTKAKGPAEKRINYLQFLEILTCLAVIRFLAIDPHKAFDGEAKGDSKSKAVGKDRARDRTRDRDRDRDNKDKEPEEEILDPKFNLANFSYCSLKGKAALVVRFTQEYLCATEDYKRACTFLDGRGTSAVALAREAIEHGASTIQTFHRNRHAVRTITLQLVALKKSKVRSRQTTAAGKMQGVVRSFLGRKRIIRLAQSMYTKFIDGETEAEYWTNPRTNSSFWSKPPLLGAYDCGVATRMPVEEERLIVTCRTCDARTATCFCAQCDEPFCTMDYAMAHRSGHRKQHEHLLIEQCVQCEFQLGVRYCVSCKDSYCDSCFVVMHRKGRMRFHVVQRTCPVCEQCGALAAQWTEMLGAQASGKLTKDWCNRCYRVEYGTPPASYPPTLVRIPFLGKSVKEYRERKEEEARKNAVKEAFEARKRQLQKMKIERAAATVQRVYRGYRERLQLSAFLTQRMEFMRVRHLEEAERASLHYRLLSLLGIAPVLKSDTPLERVMKLYPAYMHHILELSVGGKWSAACAMLLEHEQHLSEAPRSNMLSRMSARVGVRLQRRWFQQTQHHLEETSARNEIVSASYAVAEESGALSATRLRAMKLAASTAQKDMRKANKKNLAQELSLQEAEQCLVDREGLRTLQKHVLARRRKGMLLPFRVSLHKFSRVALVTWEVDLELTEEEREMNQILPGKWRELLSVMEFITIKGGTFRVCPPIIAKKKKRPASASSATSSGSAGSEKSEGSGGSDKETGRKQVSYGRKKRPGSKGSKSSDGSKKEGDAGGGAKKRPSSASSTGSGSGGEEDEKEKEESIPAVSLFDTELREECTEDHITLDRPWLQDDVSFIEIYKKLPRIFYYKPLFFAGRKAARSYVPQKDTAVMAVAHHKYGKLLQWLSTNFEEDSDRFVSLQRQVLRANLARDEWLMQSVSIVQMSFDFTLRRQVWGMLSIFFGFTATGLRMLRGVTKSLGAGSKETPFEYWKRSHDKTEISVVYDKGNDVTTILGAIKMDLKAPAEIMREHVMRSFREQLNPTIGQSFTFFRINPDTFKEVVLARNFEYKSYSKDWCFEKTDNKTMLTIMTVLLTADGTRGRVVIPEYEESKDEDDKLGEELEQLIA